MLHLVQRLAPSYPWNSPYAFSENDVIRFIDFHGGFKIDPYFAKTYPNLAKMIMYGLPEIGKDPKLIESISDVTGYSPEKVKDMFVFGNGPWISVTQDFNRSGWAGQMLDASLGPIIDHDNQGLYAPDDGFPENLIISRRFVENLEAALAKCDDQKIKESTIQVVWTILHESAHYARFKHVGKIDEQAPVTEMGALLEQQLLGMRYSYRDDRTIDVYTGVNYELDIFPQWNRIFAPVFGNALNSIINSYDHQGRLVPMEAGDPTVHPDDRLRQLHNDKNGRIESER